MIGPEITRVSYPANALREHQVEGHSCMDVLNDQHNSTIDIVCATLAKSVRHFFAFTGSASF